MNKLFVKSTFGSMMLSFLMASALLWEASGHMHDVITGPAMTPDGEWLFLKSRFWLMRSQDKGNSFTPLRNPGNIDWESTPAGPPNFILSPDFKNDKTLLFGMNLSFDAGDTWDRNLEDYLTRKEWSGVQYEICEKDPNPVAFSANFANDGTIFAVACQQADPTFATLLFSKNFGKKFEPVAGLSGSNFDSWRPMLTTTADKTYFQRTVGLDSEIFTPKSDNPKNWEKLLTLENFEIQSIREDQSSDGNLVIDRNSQTLYRMNQDGELTPITLPNAATEKAGDQLLISAYSQKGVGSNTSLIVLWSPCQNRQERLAQFGVECPSPKVDDEGLKDYIILSRDGGTTWTNLTIVDWFYKQGGGESLAFKLPEFNHVWGIPGTPTVFLGAFTGLFRSDDYGESWEELDTIATDIIGMDAAKIATDNVQLSVCAYTQSCWTGAIDVNGLRDGGRLPDGSLEQVIRLSNETESTPYSTIAFSDGIGFLADKEGVMRFADGFQGAYTELDSIPFLDNFQTATNVHGIRFSPDFENDDTMFIAGFNLGVFRSVDRGLTFENVWNAIEQPVPAGFDSVGVYVSPDFASSGVVFTYATNGSKKAEESLLFISEDYGLNWIKVDQGNDPPRLLSLTLVNDNKQAGKYSLIGIQKDGNVFLNRRKGGGQEYGQWEPLKYPVGGGSYTTVLPANSVASQGFCHDSVLGTPNGNFYMSMLTGGVALGKLQGNKFTGPKASGIEQRFRFGGTGQLFVKNKRKTYSSGIVESEGVLFGAFFNEIWASLNDGKTWNPIYSLPPRPRRFSGCEEEDKSNCKFLEINSKNANEDD